MRKHAALAAAVLLTLSVRASAGGAAEYPRGDVSQDGVSDAGDAALLRDYLICRQTLTTEQAAAADLNADSSLSAVDLTLLKRRLLTAEDGRYLLWSDELTVMPLTVQNGIMSSATGSSTPAETMSRTAGATTSRSSTPTGTRPSAAES